MELVDEQGNHAIGECAPLPEIGTETLQQCQRALTPLCQQSLNQPLEPLLEQLSPFRQEAPAACCGVESALIELLAQRQRLTPSRWMNPLATQQVRVNQIAPSLTSASLNPDAGSIIKIKVGIQPIERELAQLKAFATRLPPGGEMRLDANCGWSLEEARQFLAETGTLPIESIEEPLRQPTVESLAQLQSTLPFPIAVDESLSILGLEALLNNHTLRRLVLKPTRMGGPWTTFQTARQLQRSGKEVVITSALESSIGILSAAHCAAAVDPEGQQAHGLTTASWLAEDLGVAAPIKNGILTLP